MTDETQVMVGTRHRTKKNKNAKQQTTQKTKKRTSPTTRVNPGIYEGTSVPEILPCLILSY
jgi:hypothetical protein